MHTTPYTVLLAGDIMNWATLKTNQIGTLLKLLAVVMVIGAVLMAYWRSKSWVATLVAFVLGAFVLWGIANMPSLQTKVGSEINDTAAAPVVVQVMSTPPAPAVPGTAS
jgi:uncharacterized membrane protein YczE